MWTVLLSLLDKLFGYASNVIGNEATQKANVAVAEAQAMSAVERQWWFVAALIPAFALPFVIWIWKAVAWDKVIGPILGFHSRTDGLGALDWSFNIILTGLFLHSVMKIFDK